jgi:hypothetical protein
MPETDALERNAAATERLRALLEGVSALDLDRSLGGGWTIAVALAHLAFWDGRQRAALAHYLATGESLGEESDDAVNAGLEPLTQAVDPASAARLALEAARDVDAAVAALAPETLGVLLDGEGAYQALRCDHRDEHIAQIEAGLGR